MSTFEEYIEAHYTRNTINIVRTYICESPANAYARTFDDYFYMVTDDFDPRVYGDHENELDTYEKRYAYVNRPVTPLTQQEWALIHYMVNKGPMNQVEWNILFRMFELI